MQNIYCYIHMYASQYGHCYSIFSKILVVIVVSRLLIRGILWNFACSIQIIQLIYREESFLLAITCYFFLISDPDDTCEQKYPKCRETGGTCSVDNDGITIICNCKAGITYDSSTACNGELTSSIINIFPVKIFYALYCLFTIT